MALKVEIVSRVGELFRGEAEYVSVPSVNGALGVLPGRQPVLVALKAGTVTIREIGGAERSIEVGPGFASVDQDEISVVIDEEVNAISE